VVIYGTEQQLLNYKVAALAVIVSKLNDPTSLNCLEVTHAAFVGFLRKKPTQLTTNTTFEDELR
jgi:hypothetical protein